MKKSKLKTKVSDMAEQCGLDLRKFIQTYTGLDTHNFEEFI